MEHETGDEQIVVLLEQINGEIVGRLSAEEADVFAEAIHELDEVYDQPARLRLLASLLHEQKTKGKHLPT